MYSGLSRYWLTTQLLSSKGLLATTSFQKLFETLTSMADILLIEFEPFFSSSQLANITVFYENIGFYFHDPNFNLKISWNLHYLNSCSKLNSRHIYQKQMSNREKTRSSFSLTKISSIQLFSKNIALTNYCQKSVNQVLAFCNFHSVEKREIHCHANVFRQINPIYKTTNVCLVLPFFSETAPPILMKLGIHFIHSLKMVLK